jgi:hypothetical protein
MAGSAGEITEQVFEPLGARVQAGPPQSYPWLFTFTGEDVLEITSWNSAAGVRLTMQGRVHQPPNQLIPFQSSHTPATDRSPMTTVHTVPAGDLLNLIVYCDAGAPAVGQTFVRVVVRRGAGGAFVRLGMLIQGPVTANNARAWPGSPIVGSTEGEPYLRAITGTAPAAGSAILETVPTGARWELLSWLFNFTTSAVVADRKVFVQFTIASVAVGVVVNFSTIPASSVALFTFEPTMQSTSDAINGLFQAGWGARILLPAGSQIATSARSGQVGDLFTAPQFLVREWLDV